MSPPLPHPTPLSTLDDGVVGHRLRVASVVIKRQVPHPRVQVLDESRLVDADPALWFALGPVLFGDEPAAVQQLHKVVLREKNNNNGGTDSDR